MDARDEHWLCLVVRDRLTHTPLGLTGYQHHQRDIAEVGFLFAPAAQGRGYGYESLRALCDYAFTTGGVRRLTASVTAGNEASKQLLLKAGFRLEGELRKTTGSTDAGTTTGCSVGCVGGRCAVAHRRSQAGGSQDQRNIPPETSTRCAFIHASSSLSRAAMASPISSGSPTRPSAVWAAICRFTSALSRTSPPPKSVSMAPAR